MEPRSSLLERLGNGVYSNSTTINCNYNTITATHGGSFAEFDNVKGGVGNRVSNNTILSNGNIGINIYSSGENLSDNFINSTPNSFACHLGRSVDKANGL